MSNTFEDMTNAQLKEACEDFGLEVKAKNPAKPNKTEYLEALTAFKATQDATHGVEESDEDEVEDTAPKTDTPKRKPQSPAALMKLDLMKKDRVIIHDQQDTQTKDEMISVSWGNRLLGGQTDWIDLSGEPQYVRRGALGNLRDASMFIQTPKDGGGVHTVRKKRFIIVETDGLTLEAFEELKAQQKMRNSKLA
jgi:hypothetical protein